jgi:hypothetical protein
VAQKKSLLLKLIVLCCLGFFANYGAKQYTPSVPVSNTNNKSNNQMNNQESKILGLSFSSINCNSLNMSSAGKNNQTLKIYGITKLRTDVIFMADIRVKNKNLVSAEEDLKRLFLHNPYGQYEFWCNSSSNKRGVGILIKKKFMLQS